MRREEFFDELYRHFCISFPCYAVFTKPLGLITVSAPDGSVSVVLYTGHDLLSRGIADGKLKNPLTVAFANAPALALFLSRLPRFVTHIAFDPNPNFHRRYPVSAIQDALADPTPLSKNSR